MQILNCGTAQWFWFACAAFAVSSASSDVASGQTTRPFVRPGPNLALGKPYSLTPQPNYRYCTDPGDAKQLTDGRGARETPGNLWSQRGCVGWYGHSIVTMTIDLGEIAPIAGLSYSTVAGAADVGWPAAILILVSDDGGEYRCVGELCSLASKFGIPAPLGYQEHKFRTDELSTRARFLRLGVLVGGPFLFCDEIEVYRGPDEMLKVRVEGPVIADLNAFVSERRTALGIQTRIASDIARARKAVAAANIEPDVRKQLTKRIMAVAKANQAIPDEPDASYRAIYPLNDIQARLFDVVAELRQAQGFAPSFLWHNDPWVRLSMWDVPEKLPNEPPALSVRMMVNERRAVTLNIANFSDEPRTATVSFLGLPGGRTPEYIRVQAADYVAMQGGPWDANALPLARHDADGWRVGLPVGVSRQLWLSFYPKASPSPGRYPGQVVVAIEGSGQKLTSSLELVVEPLRFPDQTALALTMWDYAYGTGSYDLNKGNLPAAIAHMQSYPYNAPWAGSDVFPHPGPGHFDTSGDLIAPLNLSRFDVWVAKWPHAKYYMVFANVGTTFAGAKMGTEEFNERVGATMRTWADHARRIGIDPHRIAILLVDEPTTAEQDRQILTWAKAVKAAAPELLIFEDPHHADPRKAVREMFDICDILCPSRGIYKPGGPIARFYDRLRDGGRQLWFYSGSYPAIASAVSFRAHGWHCWKAKATGTGYWSYGDAGGRCNSWNPLGARSIVFSPVYIDSTSVTDGKHWLAIVEGVQDYEYLHMLGDRVDQLVAAQHSSQNLDRARRLLTTLPDDVLAGRVPCEKGRLRVLDALVSLSQ